MSKKSFSRCVWSYSWQQRILVFRQWIPNCHSPILSYVLPCPCSRQCGDCFWIRGKTIVITVTTPYRIHSAAKLCVRKLMVPNARVPTVREKSGNFKILLTRPIIYALFSQFLSASGGFAPRPPPGLRPCKHRMLVYIAIFYNGTKFSTFVYLVLFYWCRK